MKVELDNLTIGISPLSDEVFIGVNKKNEKKYGFINETLQNN